MYVNAATKRTNESDKGCFFESPYQLIFKCGSDGHRDGRNRLQGWQQRQQQHAMTGRAGVTATEAVAAGAATLAMVGKASLTSTMVTVSKTAPETRKMA